MKAITQRSQMCLTVLFNYLHLHIELLLSHSTEVVVLFLHLLDHLTLVLTSLSNALQHHSFLTLRESVTAVRIITVTKINESKLKQSENKKQIDRINVPR